MPQTHTVTTYSFAELSDAAKEKALEKLRDINTDFQWWDSTYEDAKQCAELIGIDISNIWFSGFSSQGDGACFEGSYRYAKGGLAAIKEHAPQDSVLHEIAGSLQAIQSRAFYRLSARVEHRGHYYHEHCTDIEVFNNMSGDYATEEQSKEIATELRAFMRWIYRQLEEEHEYLSSDEAVRETIEANEYQFTEKGAIY